MPKCRHWYLSSVSNFHPDPRSLRTHNTANVEAAVLLSEIHVCWKRRPQAASINCSSSCGLHQFTPGDKTKASRRESSPRYAPSLFARQQELGHNCFVICHYLFSCFHKQMGNIPSAGSTLQGWPWEEMSAFPCRDLCIETEPGGSLWHWAAKAGKQTAKGAVKLCQTYTVQLISRSGSLSVLTKNKGGERLKIWCMIKTFLSGMILKVFC